MAKKKEKEDFEHAIEKDGKVFIVTNPDHLKPQAETEVPKRPEVKNHKHLKPQE